MFLDSLVIIFLHKNMSKPVFDRFLYPLLTMQNPQLRVKNQNLSNRKLEIHYILVGWTPYAQDLVYSRVPSIPKVSRRSDKFYYQNY